MPSGVAAFPSPSRFAVTLADIAEKALLSLFRFGNNRESSGESIFDIILLSPLWSAILVIPLHKQIVPVIVMISSTASVAEVNIELVRLSVFPVKIENNILNETITNHIVFNIFTPKNNIFLQKRLTFAKNWCIIYLKDKHPIM